METELEGAGDGHGDTGKQNVEFTALQGRQTLLGRGVGKFHLVRIAEDGDGQCAAVIDEETLPATVAVR